MPQQLTLAPNPESTSGFTLEVRHTDGTVCLTHSPWECKGIASFIEARNTARMLLRIDDVDDIVIRPIADVIDDPAYRPTI